MKYTIPSEALVAHLEGEVVILHAATKDYYRLNATGQEIWRMLEKGYDLNQVADSLAASYEIERDEAYEQVSQLVDELVRSQLMVVGE